MRRAEFLRLAGMGCVALGTGAARGASGGPVGASVPARPVPLKIGIRAASMRMAGDPDVFRVASGIAGLRGVELQATAGQPSLRDRATVLRYKREADRWGMAIPSLAGIWDRGVQISGPGAAASIRASVRAAETLGSGVLLLAFFEKNAPDMGVESSYGPVVEVLRATAADAADAGVRLGLENSLSPADNARLVDLVGHPAVGVYYDPHNMGHYGHGDQAISGIALLGRDRICAVHVKNEARLIEEGGGIDWAGAFRGFAAIGYDGWYIYETAHDDLADCVRDTARNNAYLERHARMPTG